MKLAFIVPSVSRNAGGLFHSVTGLAHSLNTSERINIEIVGVLDEYSHDDLHAWKPLKPKVFPVIGPHAFSYSPKLKQHLMNLDLDIVHSHGGIWKYISKAALTWSDSTHKPIIVSTRGMLDPWAVRNSYLKKRLAGLLYTNRYLREAACLHSLAEPETRAIRQYGLRNPICQIPNGVNLPDQSTPDMPQWMRHSEEGKRVLLYLGRIHPKKGLPSLLRAWSLLKRRNSQKIEKWILVIAGWDQAGHDADLKTLVKELELKHNVFFIGPQYDEAKKSAYRYANAFILPSFSEGMPMVVLEAWSYSLPVVMTSACNLSIGFKVGGAIKIEPDALNISQGLDELFSMTDDERMHMGKRGRRLVEEQFTWNKIAAKMLSTYEWILGGGNPPECILTD